MMKEDYRLLFGLKHAIMDIEMNKRVLARDPFFILNKPLLEV